MYIIVLRVLFVVFATFVSFARTEKVEGDNKHDLIKHPSGDSKLPAFLPLSRNYPLRYRSFCLGFSATVHPGVNVNIAYVEFYVTDSMSLHTQELS